MSWISGMHNLGRGSVPSSRRDKDQDRIQCEHIAAVLYAEIERIQSEAIYCGQVEQSGEAVKGEFVRLVADIIQKELGK